MSDTSPIIFWFRRDLRLGDHPGLTEAVKSGRPVIPVFLHDEVVEVTGAAPRWRLGLGVGAFAETLSDKGSRLVLRRGKALEELRALVKETGAGAVWWSRLYDPDARQRDERVKAGLKDDGIDARSFEGHLMFEPWTVETGQGEFYKVYTPYWKAVRGRDVAPTLSAPKELPAPDSWPKSDKLEDWKMGAAMQRGAAVVEPYVCVGEDAASHRLGSFIANRVADYGEARDVPSVEGTSRLSENLTYGEISPRACWHAGVRAREEGKQGAETFLKELCWREFAYHLVHHTPRLTSDNWREEWSAFPWNEDERKAEVKAWKQGRTGIDFVDAAMREMFVTGTMHNRGRMIVASYLTKHLMCHWRIGKEWFEDCLIDWDPANNALGWQWSAGSGPDATPYFRVFNPETQAERFDKDGDYRKAWVAEGQSSPPKTALAYFDAIPKSWGMSPDDPEPEPVVGVKEGRERALDAYQNRDF
ncbi:cryptochrome/photolyase family protein [Pelagovum pacificum]|uniref:Deoxyribodipyrimidine photo-lyase n=1 Tax=Pelagovum pacificum TaxID=2588711 RepID=A0A5C5G7X4_9RHOB|nr:deoxyribodipyrimidine photo-lyase [Pelagovum pacificum]QQA41534.1 deoxyribodipyrimidine photo-lyase [Pelagovum pacificum]TNY30814.1 deoxyribodipyrimidine photo-lyase [Pelagovum pacificum]